MIIIAIPVLGRAHQIEPLLANITSATSVDHQVILIYTPTDVEGKAACEASGAQTLAATWWPGPQDFARKINHVYRETEGEWIFQGATDIEFSPGWDVAALGVATESGALVIGTNDEGNPSVTSGKHSTHTLIARSYCDDPGASMDGPGSVFSLDYEHNFTDAELVGLAKSRASGPFPLARSSGITIHTGGEA